MAGSTIVATCDMLIRLTYGDISIVAAEATTDDDVMIYVDYRWPAYGVMAILAGIGR